MAAFHLSVSYSPYNECDTTQIRVRIDCTATEGHDSCIFAYRQLNGELCFSHVCSTVDLVEMPPYSVNLPEINKWCRLDYVDLLVRHPSIAEDFVTEVKSDVRHLYKHMLKHNTLLMDTGTLVGTGETTSTEIGTPVVIENLGSSVIHDGHPVTSFPIVVISAASRTRLSVVATTSTTIENDIETTTETRTLLYTPLAAFVGVDALHYSIDGVEKDLFVKVQNGN